MNNPATAAPQQDLATAIAERNKAEEQVVQLHGRVAALQVRNRQLRTALDGYLDEDHTTEQFLDNLHKTLSVCDDQSIDNMQTLIALKQANLTFAECINAFGVASDTDPYAKAAMAEARDGEIEVDDITVLSGSGDGGEYVMCWMWISNEKAGVTKGPVLSLEELTELGYTINPDPDQAGKWYWRKDADASDISFSSQEKAIEDASENALTIYTLFRCDSCGKAHTSETIVKIQGYSTLAGQCRDCGGHCSSIDSE